MHSHLAKMLGQYILEERMEKKWLQKDLAKELDMSAQFLGRIEKGEVLIPESALIKSISLLDLKENRLQTIYRISAQRVVGELIGSVKKRKRKRA